MKKLYLVSLFLIACACSGCLTRSVTRYNAAGKPWSTDTITAFMVRGEVSKLNETVEETAKGDYKRHVLIGALKGETETDKVAAIAESIARGVATGVKP